MKGLSLVAVLVIGIVLGATVTYLVVPNITSSKAKELESICVGYGKLSEIEKRGVLIVGTSADWPPYEYVTPDGKFAGIDIELAKQIAKALGVKLEIKDMKFAALFEAVKRGDVDMAIADIAMKPQRLEAVDFSIPYRCESGKAIILRASDAEGYTGLSWLYGKKIGVQLGTTEQDLAEKYFKGKSEIKTYDRVYPEMVMDLKSGGIDAIIVAPDVAKLIVSKESGLKIVGYLPFFSCSVIALPHCAFQLKEKVSEVIWNLRQSGELDKIIQNELAKWLQQGS